MNNQSQHSGGSNPTVKNPSARFSKNAEFNDRDRLNDMLATEKYLTDGFNVFVRETSHQHLYRDILQVLNETHHTARQLFNLMFEKGWYTLQPEQSSQISSQHRKFSGYQSQFPSQSQYQQGQYHSHGSFPPLDY
ncbi:MAG: spore coat protein [Firmicutes bacterium]|nr:spore coat protein [Bacillota bacterium]